MAVKNLIQTKISLTPMQDQFIKNIIDTTKEIDSKSKIKRADVIKAFVGRFSNEPETDKTKLIMNAVKIVNSKAFM